MPYEPEVFRPARPVKASRQPKAEEARDFILVTLGWMTCPVTVAQLADKARDDWAALTEKTVLRCLQRLQTDGEAEQTSDGRWIKRRRT